MQKGKIIVLAPKSEPVIDETFIELCNSHQQEVRREARRRQEERTAAIEALLRYAIAFASGMAFVAALVALL